ncbi:MAG: WYL domain-containing protein [Actinobacteria bacterium]|nr:WYL domain-containing protein [Actinomycetota bacterium]
MSGRRGPRPTGERLRRLLVILPWLLERGEASLSEMSQRFEVSESELVKDLELAAMCGLPPFVDELVDLYIDEGRVYAGVQRLFTRPLRLTAPEGFALLAAARVAMQLPGADGDGALARALAKLAAALGDDAVVVDTPQPPATAAVADAAAKCERLRVCYWSPAADRRTEREITPRRVFVDGGAWYVIADDHLSEQSRTYRIDRIESWEPTGIIDSTRAVAVPKIDTWFEDAELPIARIRVPASETWVAERYPTRSVTAVADGWELVVSIASESWLQQLLLRLGARSQVVEPAGWIDLGPRTARALLVRYDAGTHAGS